MNETAQLDTIFSALAEEESRAHFRAVLGLDSDGRASGASESKGEPAATGLAALSAVLSRPGVSIHVL
jgi:hypothetical protein